MAKNYNMLTGHCTLPNFQQMDKRVARQQSANRNAAGLAQGIDHTSEPAWMQEARHAPLRSSGGRITEGVPASSARKASHA